MSSTFWKSVLVSPVILGITLLLSTGVRNTSDNLILNKASGSQPVTVAASEPTPATKSETDSPEVASEIVKPGDWQYTALSKV
jgi:hypothetical protein